MIAIAITMGRTTRVLLSDHPLPAATDRALRRAGYTIETCLTPKRVRTPDELAEAIAPLMQRDLFAEVAP